MRLEIHLLDFLGKQPGPISLQGTMAAGIIDADSSIHSLVFELLLADNYVTENDGTYTITPAGRNRLTSLANAGTLNDNTRYILQQLRNNSPAGVPRTPEHTTEAAFCVDFINLIHIGHVATTFIPVGDMNEICYTITPAGEAALAAA